MRQNPRSRTSSGDRYIKTHSGPTHHVELSHRGRWQQNGLRVPVRTDPVGPDAEPRAAAPGVRGAGRNLCPDFVLRACRAALTEVDTSLSFQERAHAEEEKKARSAVARWKFSLLTKALDAWAMNTFDQRAQAQPPHGPPSHSMSEWLGQPVIDSDGYVGLSVTTRPPHAVVQVVGECI